MTYYDIQWLPGENIILEHLPHDFDIARIWPSTEVSIRFLDQAPAPVPYILDLTDFQITFSDLVQVLASMVNDHPDMYSHRSLKELCVVTHSDVIRLGANALSQAQYGGVRTRVFRTLDEALAYARGIAPDVAPVRAAEQG
jgi:hypothetical protein